MEVLFLTIFLSFTLAAFFLTFFVRNAKSRHHTSPEQSALIPFRDEQATRENSKPPPPTSHS
jgi:hypothetical protein